MQSVEPGISRFRVRADARPGMPAGESTDLPKPQIRRLTAFALGFAAIARHRVLGPRQAPVGGALRGPDEIGRARKMRQCPGAVVIDIADESKLTIRL